MKKKMMKPTTLNRTLIAGGIIGMFASSIVTAIATYKAYPIIQEGKDAGKSNMEIAKDVVKYYIPSLGVVIIGAGTLAVREFLGERKFNEVCHNLERAEDKYNKVSTWYRNQTEALKEVPLDIEERKLLMDTIEKKEEIEYEKSPSTEICIFRNVVTGSEYEVTENDIYRGANVCNKLLVESGYAMCDDFDSSLGEDTPEDFRNFGWSWSTASAMWCNPWIDIKIVDTGKKNKDGKKIKDFYFICDINGKYESPFEPVEDPTNEGWC